MFSAADVCGGGELREIHMEYTVDKERTEAATTIRFEPTSETIKPTPKSTNTQDRSALKINHAPNRLLSRTNQNQTCITTRPITNSKQHPNTPTKQQQ